jgi:hypothetical protein
MSVSAASAVPTPPSYLSSPAVRFAQLQDSALSSLFGGVSGEPSDLVSLTSAVVALPMYQRPGLLTGLTQWDGTLTPGSQRAPLGSNVDKTA